HHCFRHMLADRQLIAFAPEITSERLFADHMLAGLHRLDDHRGVQIRRRADVDDIEIGVGDQIAKAAIRRRDLVATGKLDDMIASSRNGPDFDIHAVNTPVGMHVQLGHEAAAGQTDPDFRHSASAFGLSSRLVQLTPLRRINAAKSSVRPNFQGSQSPLWRIRLVSRPSFGVATVTRSPSTWVKPCPFAARSWIGANMVPRNNTKPSGYWWFSLIVCPTMSVGSRLIWVSEEAPCRTKPSGPFTSSEISIFLTSSSVKPASKNRTNGPMAQDALLSLALDKSSAERP